MTFLLLVVLLFASVGLIIIGNMAENAAYQKCESWIYKHKRWIGSFSVFQPLGCFTGILCAILLCISMFSHATSADTISECSALYDNNAKLFQEAIIKYPDTAEVSSAQGSETITTIQYKYILRVEKYNELYQWYHDFQNHWFYKAFVHEWPERLKPLTLSNDKG